MSETGYVYLIRALGDKHVKIGYSVNPVSRLAELQCANPYPLRIWAVRPGTVRDETDLHRRWVRQATVGEWFLVTPELRALAVSWRKAYPDAQPAQSPLSYQAVCLLKAQRQAADRVKKQLLKAELTNEACERFLATISLWCNRLNSPYPVEYKERPHALLADMYDGYQEWEQRIRQRVDPNFRVGNAHWRSAFVT